MFRITILLLCFVVVACKSGQAKNEFQTRSGAAKSAKTEDATKRTGKLADPDEDVIDDADAQYPVFVRKPILNPYEYSAFVANVESEHKKFGLARLAKTYKKKNTAIASLSSVLAANASTTTIFSCERFWPVA